MPNELPPKEASLFRRAAARVNYVALDRPDLSFASRIAASKMSTPREGDDLIIKGSSDIFRGGQGWRSIMGFRSQDQT